jgi:parallel beta-helix repeat protein
MRTFCVISKKQTGEGTLSNCIINANKHKHSTIIIKVNKIKITTELPEILTDVVITNDDNYPILHFEDNKNYFINKGKLTFVKILFTSNTNGMILSNQQNIMFNSCYFYNNQRNGCYINNSQNITFNSCYFYNNQYNGCYLKNSTDITFNSCQNYNNECNGIKIKNSKNTTFNTCNIYNNLKNGMFIESSTDTTITNCIIGFYVTYNKNYRGNYHSGICSTNNTNIFITQSIISKNNMSIDSINKYEIYIIDTTNIQISNCKIGTDYGGGFHARSNHSKGNIYNQNKYNYNLNLLISNSLISCYPTGITTNSYLEYLYYKNTRPNDNSQNNYFLRPNTKYLLYDGSNY